MDCAAPSRFELHSGTHGWLSVVAVALLLLVTPTVSTRHPATVLALITWPALRFLFWGGQRSIEVTPGEVVISYWLRRTRVIPTHTLQLQEMEDELVFIDGNDTFGIENALFEPGEAHRCAVAIAAVTPTPARPLSRQP